MSFTHIKDVCAVTGTYEQDGATKRRYKNVGRVMKGEDGTSFILLDKTFNPAGAWSKSGSDSIALSLFDPKEKESKGKDNPPKPGTNHEDIPF